MPFNPYKQFASGKHVNKTYLWVWEHDKAYLYYLASQYDYWQEVVEELEHRDQIFKRPPKRRPTNLLTTEQFKAYFKIRPILGFDMSDHLASVYDGLNDLEKEDYFKSLKERNNL